MAQASPPRPVPLIPPPSTPPAQDTTKRAPVPTDVGDRPSGVADTNAVPLPARSTTRDTTKAPIAVAERGALPEIGDGRVRWDREAMFASGALNLAELLAQVPGASLATAGFIAAPTALSWYGQPGRVRVFQDGVELDELDPRTGGSAELSYIQLWTLEEVAVERSAGELRVHLRTWRVRYTSASTRTDVLTGSENLNLYRGFFGRRYGNGAVLQLGGQQFSTTSTRTGGDGDGLGAFMRLGVARGRLTVDGVATRYGRTRSATTRYPLEDTPTSNAIAGFKGSDLTAYARVAWGNADSTGLWAQGVAATLQHIENDGSTSASPGGSLGGAPTAGDLDTSVVRSQYVAAVGFTRWGVRLSGTGRWRAGGGESQFAPVLRGSYEHRWGSLAGFVERSGRDSTDRLELSGRLTPFAWLQFGGSVAEHRVEDPATRGPSRSSVRVGGAIRLRGRWISGSFISQGAARVQGTPIFGAEFVAVDVPALTGIEAGVSGPIVGPLGVDWRVTRWESGALYRPQTTSRAQLRVSTGLPKRFPRGNFHITAAGIHEYRSQLLTPLSDGTRLATGTSTLSSLVEIRIGTATLSWQNRNLLGAVFESAAGYLTPRQVQIYGVRWEFWN